MRGAASDRLPVRFAPEVFDAERTRALTVLAGLRVRRAEPVGAYRRAELSVSWARFPGVGLDMKDYVFARHLSNVVFEPDGFTVRSGLLAADPYTGTPVEFRLEEDPSNWRIQIDHLVSLHDAWDSGGHAWSPDGRNWQALANDPGNLLPTDRRVNAAKGDRAADRWLPVEGYRARFVVLQIEVKNLFRLSVTEAEGAAMRAVLTG